MSFLRTSIVRNAAAHDLIQLLTRAQQPRTTVSRTLQRPLSPPKSLHTRSTPFLRRPHRTIRSPQSRNNSTHSKDSARPNPDVTPNLNSPQPQLSLSQRLKKLSREYGWAAFGIYMALSALDFPFCFLAVRLVGTERIGELEHLVVGTAKRVVWEPLKAALGMTAEQGAAAPAAQIGTVGEGFAQIGQEQKPPSRWGVEEAQEEASKNEATLWTQLVLAYAIHKSFIFIRVPLTAAITPRVVKTLRGWGWNIGKRTPAVKTLEKP